MTSDNGTISDEEGGIREVTQRTEFPQEQERSGAGGADITEDITNRISSTLFPPSGVQIDDENTSFKLNVNISGYRNVNGSILHKVNSSLAEHNNSNDWRDSDLQRINLTHIIDSHRYDDHRKGRRKFYKYRLLHETINVCIKI